MLQVRLKVAVVGTGISGLAAAWMLSQRHEVTVYEQADRIGARATIVLDDDGAAQLRDMRSGEQRPLELGRLIEELHG